ncbi:MAG: ABC transporter ATP-binding protein [Rhizobiales bacterium PAR1]|nr:MAG: ABC transporter ATP-binding protein [Rhizobiales bacterium PAR1]
MRSVVDHASSRADDAPVLRLEGVRRSFGIGTDVEIEILHGIDLVIQRGEFCALIGPSGSGKSTLLNIIGLLDRATAGKVFITGEDTDLLGDAELTRLRSRSIGFVFQNALLIPAFTALENVMMPQLVDKGWPDAAMRENASRLLGRVGLEQRKDNLANAMSGGQQQRVAIARALAMNPALVLADEPTGNLDTKSAEAVLKLMREVNLANGTTFLIVTHNMELAEQTDRIIEVVDGMVVSGTTRPTNASRNKLT